MTDQLLPRSQRQAVKDAAERLARKAERTARKAANQGAWKADLKAHREKDPMAWSKSYAYADPLTLPAAPPPPSPGGDIVPAGYWDGLADAAGRPGGAGGPLLLERAELFDELLGLSLQRALDTMRIDLKDMDPNDKNFQKIMSTQQSIMSSVFSTAARIDEAKLRARETDKLDEVLDALHREERKAAGAPVIEAEFTAVKAQDTRTEADVLRELLG